MLGISLYWHYLFPDCVGSVSGVCAESSMCTGSVTGTVSVADTVSMLVTDWLLVLFVLYTGIEIVGNILIVLLAGLVSCWLMMKWYFSHHFAFWLGHYMLS